MKMEDVIDLKECAELAGYGLRTLYNLVHQGKVKARRTAAGFWFTTRQEAQRLRNADRPKRGRPPKGECHG